MRRRPYTKRDELDDEPIADTLRPVAFVRDLLAEALEAAHLAGTDRAPKLGVDTQPGTRRPIVILHGQANWPNKAR